MLRSLIAECFAVLALLCAPFAQAEDGVTDSSVLIGQTIGLTGQVAGAVKELNEGANAYLAQVNRQGGVNGRRIELLTLDDHFNPTTAAKNARILAQKKHVFALFQNRGTPHTEAILPVLIANNIPLVAPSTGAALLHTPVNALVFPVRARYQEEVLRTISHFSTLGLREIGLVHIDDSFGRDVLAGFNDAMKLQKLTPAMEVGFDRAKPDLHAALAAVRTNNPSALIIAGSATSTAELIKAIRQQGGKMALTTLSNNASNAFIESLGSAAAGIIVSQITPAPDLLTTVLGQEFRIAAKANGATVSYSVMEGFVAAKVLVEGLRRAGRNLTRESFVAALESLHKVDFGGISVNYDHAYHTGSEFVELTMIGKGGHFIR